MPELEILKLKRLSSHRQGVPYGSTAPPPVLSMAVDGKLLEEFATFPRLKVFEIGSCVHLNYYSC